MMEACAKRTQTGVGLRAAQIRRARKIAATGEARVCESDEDVED